MEEPKSREARLRKSWLISDDETMKQRQEQHDPALQSPEAWSGDGGGGRSEASI